MIDQHPTMKALAGRRPVFHSEADFQHAIAVQISETVPKATIRLECRSLSDERAYLDLWDEGRLDLPL